MPPGTAKGPQHSATTVSHQEASPLNQIYPQCDSPQMRDAPRGQVFLLPQHINLQGESSTSTAQTSRVASLQQTPAAPDTNPSQNDSSAGAWGMPGPGSQDYAGNRNHPHPSSF